MSMNPGNFSKSLNPGNLNQFLAPFRPLTLLRQAQPENTHKNPEENFCQLKLKIPQQYSIALRIYPPQIFGNNPVAD